MKMITMVPKNPQNDGRRMSGTEHASAELATAVRGKFTANVPSAQGHPTGGISQSAPLKNIHSNTSQEKDSVFRDTALHTLHAVRVRAFTTRSTPPHLNVPKIVGQ